MGPRPLVAVDVGNTTISFARRDPARWGRVLRHPAGDPRGAARRILRLAERGGASIALGSVHPDASRELAASLSRRGVRVLDVLPALRRLVPARVRRPRQVGCDRLANALAVRRRPGRGALVVDFGTAVTFDLVSPRGEFLGGAISPGPRLAARALAERTALLPGIRIRPPRGFVGRDTVSAMRAGIVLGIAALVEGMIASIRREARFPIDVVATGGDAATFRRLCPSLARVDPRLTLEGIRRAAAAR